MGTQIMKYRRSAGDVARTLLKEFGYVVLGTDDELAIGEHIPNLVSQGRRDDGVSGVVTERTTFAAFEVQAVFAGFEDTCTDCFDYYFKVTLDPPVAE
jgi:hypothetical protein